MALQEAIEVERRKHAELDGVVRATSSLAADANSECAATRVLVGESRQEGLAEARKEAEAIAGRAEGRVSECERRSIVLGPAAERGLPYAPLFSWMSLQFVRYTHSS